MKNKRGIMVEFLLRLIVAILFVAGAIAVGKSLFSVTSQGEQSFNNLVTQINKIEEETVSMNLIMDEKTMILYFNKNSDYMGFIKLEENLLNKFFGHGNEIEYIKKPNGCPTGKPCACLCQDKLKKDEGGYSRTIPILYEGYDAVSFYHCNKILKCVEVNRDKILREGLYSTSIGLCNFANHIFKDGFFIERGNLCGGGSQGRSQAIYIESYKGVIGICKNTPCILDEVKKQIDEKKP